MLKCHQSREPEVFEMPNCCGSLNLMYVLKEKCDENPRLDSCIQNGYNKLERINTIYN